MEAWDHVARCGFIEPSKFCSKKYCMKGIQVESRKISLVLKTGFILLELNFVN